MQVLQFNVILRLETFHQFGLKDLLIGKKNLRGIVLSKDQTVNRAISYAIIAVTMLKRA